MTCMRSSISLHRRNLDVILVERAPRDMDIVDDILPPTAFDTIKILINVMGIRLTVIVVYPASALHPCVF